MEENNRVCGRRVRAFRKLKRYTQQELATSVHVSVSIIGAIERGKKTPTVHLLSEVAKFLEVDIQELMKEERRKH